MSPKKSFLSYPSVKLLNFNIDAFSMSTTKECLQAFYNLNFPCSLQVLKSYLGASGFLRHLIPYYAKLAEPLQLRKTALLAEGHAQGYIIAGHPQKYLAYTASIYYEPILIEVAAFQVL